MSGQMFLSFFHTDGSSALFRLASFIQSVHASFFNATGYHYFSLNHSSARCHVLRQACAHDATPHGFHPIFMMLQFLFIPDVQPPTHRPRS